MDNNELKIGDIVKLKGGSPEMTVIEFGYNGTVSAMWFPVDLTGSYLAPQTISVHPNALQKIDA